MVATNQAQCKIDSVPPTDCAAKLGKFQTTAGDTPDAIGTTICTGGCEAFVNVSGIKRTDGKYASVAQHTGKVCTGSTNQTMGTETNSNEYCATTAAGRTFCVPHPKKNCGYYNNEYVCVGSIPPDNCIQTASGKRFCASTAPTPPTPDNGTPGVKATPADTITTVQSQAATPGSAPSTGQTITTNITNVYDSGQVAGSSRGGPSETGTVATPPGGGTVGGGKDDLTGSGDTPTDTPSEDDGSGVPCNGVNCEFAPAPLDYTFGTGEGASVPALNLGTGVDLAMARIQTAPLIAAIGDVGASWPNAGSCPNATMNLSEVGLGTHNLMGWGCDLWENNIADVLYVLMTALWAVMGLRVILEA